MPATKGPLKVLHLIPQMGGGGVARVIQDIVAGSKREGVESLIVSSSAVPTFPCAWKVAPLFPSTAINVIRSFFVVRRLARSQGVAVIHSHHRFASLVGRAVAWSLHLPFVCTVHDLAGGRRWITRLGLGRQVLVFSTAVENHLAEQFGLPRKYVTRMPMGVPLMRQIDASEKGSFKAEVNCESDAPIVTFVGRLEVEKGPDLFVRSIPFVVAKIPTAAFWIVGEGEMLNDLRALVSELRVEPNVRFVGWRDDMELVMGASDVIIVPSRREGFGRVALEAMTLQKPVVASRTGGLADLVEDERTGLLVSAEAGAIASAALSLLEDPTRAVELGLAAYQTTLGKHSVEAMVRETIEVYRTVADRHGADSRPVRGRRWN
jgi:glycosyltransferase involved in cell wall biosynthesis